jgi:hypothetical protein
MVVRMEISLFLNLVSRMDNRIVPNADADDFKKGAYYIPGCVTILRREGVNVEYLGDNIWKYPSGVLSNDSNLPNRIPEILEIAKNGFKGEI